MNIVTNDQKPGDKVRITPELRRIRTAELRKAHESYFETIGVPDALFLPKSFYPHGGKDVIGMFESERKAGRDVYTEKVDFDVISEDSTRTLYKWGYNVFWETEYEKGTSSTSSRPRWFIPADELVIIGKETTPEPKLETAPKQTTLSFNDLMNPDQDMPIEQETWRDMVARTKWKPVSTKKWINELIVKHP